MMAVKTSPAPCSPRPFATEFELQNGQCRTLVVVVVVGCTFIGRPQPGQAGASDDTCL